MHHKCVKGGFMKHKHSEMIYHQFVETLNDGIWVVDKSLVTTFVNPRMSDMLGYNVSEMLGKHIHLFMDKSGISIYERNKQLRENGIKDQFDYELIRKDGRKIFVTMETAPIFDKFGNYEGVISGVKDITGRALLIKELKQSHDRLRNLSYHMENSREKERSDISGELYEKLGQNLAGLKLELSSLKNRLMRDCNFLMEKIDVMAEMIDSSVRVVDNISVQLRPSILDNLGIAAAVEWLTEEFRKKYDIPCSVSIKPDDLMLEKELSTLFFRVLQELLSNVARHSGASKVRICLKRQNRRILLLVGDNGKGITKLQAESPVSLGLSSIRERINFFHGDLRIRGRENRGTIVSVCVSLS